MIFAVYRKDLQTGESKKIGSSDSSLVASEIAVADASSKSEQLLFDIHICPRDATESAVVFDPVTVGPNARYEYTIMSE